ncbi:MAG: hypothetical protein K2H64_01805 [Desulfovibrio sp.]|nr:hypothetical protein [Desulfovibrio sp.]
MERSDKRCSLMTEAEARSLLREFMERPYKGRDWPKVWIGEALSTDELGYMFQATYYQENENPEEGWQRWSVDPKTRTCMLDIM